MLQRRNTIHPGTSHPSRHTLNYAPTNSNTNPFLGRSSFDNLTSLTKHVHNAKSTEITNPFLFDLIHGSKGHYRATKTKDDIHHQQQEGDNIRARRSLYVLKAPFSWNRRRTNSVSTPISMATKPKSSKRPATVFVPSEKTDYEEVPKEVEGPHQEWQTTTDSFTCSSSRGDDEILKTSRYFPDEEKDPIHGNLPTIVQSYQERRKSLNPFLNDSGPILDQQVLQAPEQPTTQHTGQPPRRRHSEFSGLSMEDCSRMLSKQNAQVQQEEGVCVDRTASLRHSPPQHRRYSSVHHTHTRHQGSFPRTPPPSLRTRCHTVVARSPASNYVPSHRTYQLVDPGVQKSDITVIKLFDNMKTIDTNYDPWANVARNISAGNFTDPHPTSPLDDDLPQPSRPWNCSRQGSRRSSQSSYAQEFSKDSDRYRPWVWASSNSSYAPSFSSSPSMKSPASMYCDEESTYTSLDRESLRVKSRYREMKEIQLRPYGQDDEDEADDVDADEASESNYPEESVHPFDNLPDTHERSRDADIEALHPYKQALRDDYDTSPRASDVALSEECQQELYRMALACSPASTRVQQYHPPEYGHHHLDSQQQYTLNPSATTNSIASSGTLKSKGRASLTRTKTVLSKVKRRVSAAAQTVVTQANHALVRKNTESSLSQSPQEDRQLPILKGEGTRDENEYAHYLDSSHYLYQRYDCDYDQAYSGDICHEHRSEHDNPTSPKRFESNSNGGSLGGSRSESSNSIRRSLYSASRSSLHRSKILLRQVKRRVSNAAQSMVSHAESALSWKLSHDGSMEEVNEVEELERNGQGSSQRENRHG